MNFTLILSSIIILISIIAFALWFKNSFDFEAWINEYANDSWD